MKKFLSDVIKFFCLNMAIVLAAVIVVYFMVSKASFDIPEDRNIIIVGDSHTECAIDDSIFLRSFNISQSGTAYLYSYVKLRKFLAENLQIDTVLVSFHGGSIQKPLDEWIVGKRNIISTLPIYFSLLKAEELSIFIHNPTFYSAFIKLPVKSVRAVLKYIIRHTLTYKDLYIGGYLKLNRDKLPQAIERQGNNTDAETGYSNYQLEYLLKIVDLCEERNIKLILFNAPTYNSKEYGNLRELQNFYNTYFAEIEYLDYSAFPLPDYGYGDIGHLNFKGAEIFSEYLEKNYEDIFGN